MDVGRMNHRITIEGADRSHVDAAGQPITEYAEVCSVWANVRFERGTEAMRNGIDTAVRRGSVRIRYREDIDEDMRLIHRGMTYAITNVLPDEETMEFMDLLIEKRS
ncbi:phage head closure protein [Photobacterium indicum]|uniref:Head-tail adaptor protein n=1 Tax=Photobacterium indicum TaxID=81447 RepID=A0A2T3LAI3_9GAMM|nr:head-tail adaptor protein [Photobacterium indicum]